LSGHAAGNGVDCKSNFNSVLDELFGQLGDGILSLGYGHTVSRDDDNAFAVCEEFGDLFGIGLDVFAVLGGFCFGSACSPAPEDDVFK